MKIEQIETDKNRIDYITLNLTRKILSNNLTQMGKEYFLGSYYTKLGFYTKTWPSVCLRYLIALLEYLNPDFSYNGEIYMGKPIVANERVFQEIINGNSHLLEDLEAKTPSSFRKYGMLMEAKEIVSA